MDLIDPPEAGVPDKGQSQAIAADAPRSAVPGAPWRHSLSARLFAITIAAILLVEMIIFIPSAANFRWEWLEERADAGRVAALALEAAPSRMVSAELSSALLVSAEVLAVAEIEIDKDGTPTRTQLLAPQVPIAGDMKTIDIRDRQMLSSMAGALDSFFSDGDRTLVVIAPGSADNRTLEVVVPEKPLTEGLIAFCHRIIGLSLIISIAAGALIFALLVFMVVRPMRRITNSVEQFHRDPGSWTRRLRSTPRRDEIGRAQNALADMERAVSDSFRQQDRLAQLGQAVAKINHDLRGSLATVQLVSDGLTRSEDPRVQKALPRMERALERAITLASNTLQYGKAEAPKANLRAVNVHACLEEAAEEALAPFEAITWTNDVPDTASVLADADNLHRIATNLIRNAAQAMDGTGAISASGSPAGVVIRDTGQGLPETARDNLFVPFAGSSRRDGTGLGLAIARDLARAMGGDLTLTETGETGTAFTITLQPAGGAES